MSTEPRTNQPGGAQTAGAPAIVSHGWLGAESIFEQKDTRRLGRAMGASLLSHGLIAAALMAAVFMRPEPVTTAAPPPEYDIVFVHVPGPGGGGGGNPTPAPPRPKPLEIPKPPKAQPIPVTPPPQVDLEPPKMPQLTAPIYTNSATELFSSGSSTVSLAPFGGSGRGRGVGEGQGSGVGPGEGGGFGGGAYRMGSGVTDPTLVKQEAPKYTSEAMRAKIQGIVELEAVVMPNGSVGDVRITKSLDARFGLDQEAIRAAKAWLFRPGTLQGEPVPVLVTLILEFRLH
jgi:protein TonB